MNRLTSIIASLFISAIIISSCQNTGGKDGQQEQQADSVAVFTLKKEQFDKNMVFPGELISFDRAAIYAKVAGYVNDLKVDIGDAVQRGQTLIVLDAPEITADFAEASADAQVAEAKYRGSLDAYNRILNADKVPGTVAPGEKESSKSRMQSDSSAWEAAKSKLNAYEQLKDYLTIRAPFSGVVTERNADPGTLVSSANSQPLMVVENNSKLRLRIPVPEAYTAAAPKDGKVGFTVDAYPGVQFEAALSRKAGAINLQNRTEAWEFLYDNSDKKLKSGMFANCTVSFQRSAPSFVVPVTAIVTTQEKRFVIRLSDGQAEWVDIRTGITLSDAIEIFGNLSEGDILVQRGNDEIQPGKRLVAK